MEIQAVREIHISYSPYLQLLQPAVFIFSSHFFDLIFYFKQDRRYSDPKARNGSKTKKNKIRRIPKIS